MFNHPSPDPRLSTLINKADQENGVFIKDLQIDDVVEINTLNHTYTLTILDPKTQKIEVTSNGSRITTPTVMHATGSNLGGTAIKQGWVAVGYSFELGKLLISPTQTIRINGVQILPRDTKEKAN